MKIVRCHFKSISSTNSWAKENAQSFEKESLTIVTADQQVSGRGRLGRSWFAPAGKNLSATFCFFLDPQQKDLGNLSQVSSLATVKALNQHGFYPKLKWPNDIYLQNKKLSGILTEICQIDNRLFIAIGIGININMLPEEALLIDQPATSLLIEGGMVLDIEELLQELQIEYLLALEKFIHGGFAPFLESYRNCMMHLENSKMSFRDSQRVWNGHFLGINSDGSLSMELDDGLRKQFSAGELI